VKAAGAPDLEELEKNGLFFSSLNSKSGQGDAMFAIRLGKADWGKAWRAMIEVAPVRLVAGDPIYEVLPAHLELLASRGFSYEVVTPQPGRKERRRHGTSH
jgi:hypothetical protein